LSGDASSLTRRLIRSASADYSSSDLLDINRIGVLRADGPQEDTTLLLSIDREFGQISTIQNHPDGLNCSI
jgi:hypothetical protein